MRSGKCKHLPSNISFDPALLWRSFYTIIKKRWNIRHLTINGPGFPQHDDLVHTKSLRIIFFWHKNRWWEEQRLWDIHRRLKDRPRRTAKHVGTMRWWWRDATEERNRFAKINTGQGNLQCTMDKKTGRDSVQDRASSSWKRKVDLLTAVQDLREILQPVSTRTTYSTAQFHEPPKLLLS